ncbi:MAG: MBL fold metallo-hydrolase [Planctomycetota bacterium]|nr:MBL fold metallo-hydrolase [Planctomycetota bacterium]
MSIAFQVLGSSSSGNATLLSFRTDHAHHHLLLDAGLGPRTVAGRMKELGLEGRTIEAIVLTHADSDHMRSSWTRTLQRTRTPVHVPRAHLAEAERKGVPPDLLRPFDRAFQPVAGVEFDPIRTPHDQTGSAAFRIRCGDASLGWATDLGSVEPALLEHLAGVDALGIESNYDPVMQRESGRSPYLIERIMGGRGHLSNQQCLEAVRTLADRPAEARPLGAVVLLHLSRDCNCRERLRRFWERNVPELADRMEISWPNQPGSRVELDLPRPDPVQLGLFA